MLGIGSSRFEKLKPTGLKPRLPSQKSSTARTCALPGRRTRCNRGYCVRSHDDVCQCCPRHARSACCFSGPATPRRRTFRRRTPAPRTAYVRSSADADRHRGPFQLTSSMEDSFQLQRDGVTHGQHQHQLGVSGAASRIQTEIVLGGRSRIRTNGASSAAQEISRAEQRLN